MHGGAGRGAGPAGGRRLRDGRFLATPATCDWPRVDMGPAASTWRPACKCRLGADDASDPRPYRRMNGDEPTGEGHHGTAHRRPVVAIRLAGALAVGVAGALAGYSAGYWIGRRWGPRLLSSPLGRRVGPVRLHKVGGGPCPARLRRRCWLASGPPPHRASRPPARRGRPGRPGRRLAGPPPGQGVRGRASPAGRGRAAPRLGRRQVDFAYWLQVRSSSEGRRGRSPSRTTGSSTAFATAMAQSLAASRGPPRVDIRPRPGPGKNQSPPG
jgi:hypothetical protein